MLIMLFNSCYTCIDCSNAQLFIVDYLNTDIHCTMHNSSEYHGLSKTCVTTKVNHLVLYLITSCKRLKSRSGLCWTEMILSDEAVLL